MSKVSKVPCTQCEEKNVRLEHTLRSLLKLIDTQTMFVTLQNDGRLVVYAGGSVCTDEFECTCEIE